MRPFPCPFRLSESKGCRRKSLSWSLGAAAEPRAEARLRLPGDAARRPGGHSYTRHAYNNTLFRQQNLASTALGDTKTSTESCFGWPRLSWTGRARSSAQRGRLPHPLLREVTRAGAPHPTVALCSHPSQGRQSAELQRGLDTAATGVTAASPWRALGKWAASSRGHGLDDPKGPFQPEGSCGSLGRLST